MKNRIRLQSKSFFESILERFLAGERGDGVTEYGTVLAYSALAFALVVAIVNAAQSDLVSTLSDDVAARVQWMAAKEKGTWN